ncbi:DUF1054 domain-containing protein [Robertmurraya yapensis]|uniref:UPF0637 protein EKG37_09550 n=2 Tax=Bacillaceae TaxID=186817 RepID=A0A431WAQ9_9BACI|nr:DUF1054 domain-containing protein [Bacillus yapensis]RTR32398.1 DUF1054 domain-containing protein [Bacillus yapensis]TKS96592.1 DUF1054 domain-containing protein [Bacillus yapensis]
MIFSGFTNQDFDVFKIDGFEPRMDALKSTIRPKLEALGQHFAPTLATMTGTEMFAHVAKHARRTVNPPKDTWVAFASNPRGYKMLPHFQIGLWETHVFIWFAVIYEAPNKEELGQKLAKKVNTIYKETNKDFVWSGDHMKPDVSFHSELSKEELKAMFERLQTVKKAEILCGYQIPREKAVAMSREEFISKVESVFNELLPLYKLA